MIIEVNISAILSCEEIQFLQIKLVLFFSKPIKLLVRDGFCFAIYRRIKKEIQCTILRKVILRENLLSGPAVILPF